MMSKLYLMGIITKGGDSWAEAWRSGEEHHRKELEAGLDQAGLNFVTTDRSGGVSLEMEY